MNVKNLCVINVAFIPPTCEKIASFFLALGLIVGDNPGGLKNNFHENLHCIIYIGSNFLYCLGPQKLEAQFHKIGCIYCGLGLSRTKVNFKVYTLLSKIL
jgi:hypothetical protein